MGAGVYESVPEACRQVIRIGEPQQANPDAVKRYGEIYEVYRALYPALKDSYAALAAL